MSFRFDPRFGLIVVEAKLIGPSGEALLRLALDTGATATLINEGMLIALGYKPQESLSRIKVTTGSGVKDTPQIAVNRITCLGQVRNSMMVLAHNLPPGAAVDGLLGLDFFRARKLRIDFAAGTIDVE